MLPTRKECNSHQFSSHWTPIMKSKTYLSSLKWLMTLFAFKSKILWTYRPHFFLHSGTTEQQQNWVGIKRKKVLLKSKFNQKCPIDVISVLSSSLCHIFRDMQREFCPMLLKMGKYATFQLRNQPSTKCDCCLYANAKPMNLISY